MNGALSWKVPGAHPRYDLAIVNADIVGPSVILSPSIKMGPIRRIKSWPKMEIGKGSRPMTIGTSAKSTLMTLRFATFVRAVETCPPPVKIVSS